MATPGYRLVLEDRPGYLYAAIHGEQDSYDVTMGATADIAAVCKERGTTKLLVENHLSGRLSTLEIFKIASRIGELFQGVQVGVVIHHSAMPDNPEFLLNVARNRGGTGRLFSDPAEAEAWLLSL